MRSPGETVYRSFAKLNLYLDIAGKRPDGFHEIRTVFQSVDLYDELRFQPCEGDVQLECDNPTLPIGPGNLILRAAEMLREHTESAAGARISLNKCIPVAAGLAGGSGNAAAALMGLNELWQLGVTAHDLTELAARLGSDVPFCLLGGTAAGTGRGEVLRPLNPLPPVWIVMVHPPLQIHSRDLFAHPALLEASGPPAPSFEQAVDDLARGRWSAAVYNRMETPAFRDYPQLAEIKTRLLEAGAAAAAMSGSGPTMFGICPEEAPARGVAARFEELPTSVVTPVNQGVMRIA